MSYIVVSEFPSTGSVQYESTARTNLDNLRTNQVFFNSEFVASAGSKTDLHTRLAVAINNDGTLKTGTPAGSEWFSDTVLPVKTSDVSFTFTGVDKTTTYTVGRAVRMNETLYGHVLSVSYGADTLVTLQADSDTVPVTFTEIDYGLDPLCQVQEQNIDATTITLANSGLHILDTNASHDLIFSVGSNLTADKTLTFTTGDSDRTITLSGNPTLSDWFDQSVKAASSPTFGGIALGTGNLTLTGSIASTGSRVTKGWFTDIAVTNAISGITLTTPEIGAATGTSFTTTNTTYADRSLTSATGGVLNIALGSAAGDDFTVDTDKLVVEGDTGNVKIGGYILGAKNFRDTSANVPAYWFDGVDDRITIANDANLNLTSNGTFLLGFKNSAGGSFHLSKYQDSSNSWYISIDSTNFFSRTEIGNVEKYRFYAQGFADEAQHLFALVQTGGVSSELFNNGIEITPTSESHAGGDISNTGNIWIQQYDSSYGNGEVNRYCQFNLALDNTDTIDKAIINGGAIPFKYIGASQAVLTSGTLIIGKKYSIDTFVTGDDFTNIGGTNVTGNTFIATGATPTTWANSSSLRQIGCVLDLNGNGIGHNQWLDNSGNGLHGAVPEALPTNLKTDHTEKYIDLTVTGNTFFTLPQGYKITSIVVVETAGNALTGGLDVGLTTNGVEIVSGEAIGANAIVNCTLIASGQLGGTFTTADDTIYISDGNDDANWDSASLEITVSMEKIR